MVRALLDANVLVSAAIRVDGPPGRIVTALLARDAFKLVLSPAIVAEVERVLRRPRVRKHVRAMEVAQALLADLVLLAELVPDTGRVTGACRDPADDAVLAAAIEGRAGVIVSGDADLLSLGEYEGIAIMTPRAFLNLLGRRA